jgi:hypothetical protein
MFRFRVIAGHPGQPALTEARVQPERGMEP